MKHFFDDRNSAGAVFWSRLLVVSRGFSAWKKPAVVLLVLACAGGCWVVLQDRAPPPVQQMVVDAAPLAWLSPKISGLADAETDSEFVALAGGTFVMGDTLDNLRDATPHEVTLGAFAIGRHEVTLKLWTDTRTWARSHGYTDLPAAQGKADDHPVYGITWYEAVKWCNARSEREGRTPCYYEDQACTRVLRTGGGLLTERHVRWETDGYRLPTEAEWEMAARGGLRGKRFPWGDDLTHKHANYTGSTKNVSYDKSGRDGPPPAFLDGLPHTAPVGSFVPNGFGLHDMAGNVWEWCWDFYDKHYGVKELASNEFTALALKPPPSAVRVTNPQGPNLGTTAVARGGSWRHTAEDARCASRYDAPTTLSVAHMGFRLARGL